MNLLVVLPRFPFPTDKGDKLRAYHQLKYLSKSHKVHLLCTTYDLPTDEELNEVKKYCESVKIFEQSFILAFILGFAGLFNFLPIQVSLFTNYRLRNKVRKLVKAGKVDLIYAQLVRSLHNVPKNLGVPIYVDYMDCFSYGMKKRGENSSNLFQAQFFKWESKMMKAYEAKSRKKISGASIITDQDAERTGLSKSLFDIVPNGVGVPEQEYQLEEEVDLVFVGNMGYFPNVRAVKYIVAELLPELWKVLPDLKLHIVGIGPKQEVLELAGDKVIVTGKVVDVYAYLKKAKVFVAPLFTGQGLQNKILESLIAGLPVVTTSNARNALNSAEESGVVQADTKQEFVENILDLLKDSHKRGVLSQQGINFISQYYRWDSVNAPLEQRLLEVSKHT